jgi:formylmethanofuran dehydrogenase subunit C
MALVLSVRTTVGPAVDLSSVAPCALSALDPAEVGKRKVLVGRQEVELGEIFWIHGSLDDLTLIFEGDLSGAVGVGASLAEGRVIVRGSVGHGCGALMTGGSVVVEGDAGAGVGAGMGGGTIHVRGSVGDDLGHDAARLVGMSGGTIVVDGSAGAHVGRRIRRGTIAVRGTAGDGTMMDAVAGTVVLMGACGRHAGAGMRRGSLFLLGDGPTEILPTFRPGRTTRPLMLSLLLPHLAQLGFAIDPSLVHGDMRLYHGDMTSLGLGEIFALARGGSE